MLWTCTSRRAPATSSLAFTVIELLVGVSLAACLALALAPVWSSWERTGDGEVERTIWFAQSRVAVARFERDVRLANAAECPFVAATAILEASPSQIVLVARGEKGERARLVEWEIAKGSLMRRWGMCPQQRPVAFTHSYYVDSKTMLANVLAGSELTYYAGSRRLDQPLSRDDLDSVSAVVLELTGHIAGVSGEVEVCSNARVGR